MLRAAAIAGSLFGKLFSVPIMAPHVHTPHCEPGCAIIFAPHSHSAACNHAAAPEGALLEAAKACDVAGVAARLAAGDSTEQVDEVGYRLGASRRAEWNSSATSGTKVQQMRCFSRVCRSRQPNPSLPTHLSVGQENILSWRL